MVYSRSTRRDSTIQRIHLATNGYPLTTHDKSRNRELLKGALVAYYGLSKPAQLTNFINQVQVCLTNCSGDSLHQRPIANIHSTIIGLDALGPITLINTTNRLLAPSSSVDLVGFIEYLDQCLTTNNMRIRFGGFHAGEDSMESRGMSLFERSLTCSDNEVVLIGWPLDASGKPCSFLDKVRRHAQAFGLRHRYPLSTSKSDPDAHMVMGDLIDPVGARTINAHLMTLRNQLSHISCTVPLSARDISLVLYRDPRLPRHGTKVLSLHEARDWLHSSGPDAHRLPSGPHPS